MDREYAVENENGAVLFQTAGFDAAHVSARIPLSGGAVLCVSGEDGLIQENERLQQLLEQANAANVAKETFLSNMSHDIRTPMNAIVGLTALAKRHIDEKARVADALNKIETASAHLLNLINDVLDMSRINSGRMKLSSERFSLSDLLHDTMTILLPQIRQKRHAYTLTADGIEVESFYGDALRLRQVLVNIISNAVKYTNEGGRIDIRVSEKMLKDRCQLIFACQDSGIGMSEDFLKRIFEPFERVNSSTISKIEGTGLGMSIVKKTVEAMAGEIAIESQVGKGTLVTVRVPLSYEQEQADASALQDKNLLIIEADERLRAAYERYLGEYGLKSTLVSSAGGALSALTDADFQGRKYSAVIIGRSREDTSSVFDVAGYLHKSFPDIAIVLISDDNWEQIEYQANRSGIQHFIPLPFFRKSLLKGLGEALRGTDGEENDPAVPDWTGKRILLVEDNMINREIAREVLSMTNAQIDTAENGQQAVEQFTAAEAGYYSLILMDIQMPVMDGYAATRAIRQGEGADGKTIPIFAMTANTFAEDIARAREAGMNGHLAKPIDFNALMQVLRQVRA